MRFWKLHVTNILKNIDHVWVIVIGMVMRMIQGILVFGFTINLEWNVKHSNNNRSAHSSHTLRNILECFIFLIHLHNHLLIFHLISFNNQKTLIFNFFFIFNFINFTLIYHYFDSICITIPIFILRTKHDHNVSRIFYLYFGIISYTQNKWSFSEYYSQLVNFLKEFKLYHPITFDMGILKHQRAKLYVVVFVWVWFRIFSSKANYLG